jgi:3-hydroxy-9,10-secoandrosta-1,3,5(10)-triene-9,17-dione monooxygenase reductase component
LSTTATFDTRAFRSALGVFPTGVAIVTTRAADGSLVGLTINSFSSLSLDPPLVLWSLNSNSPSLSMFRDGSHFTVNILAQEQANLSQRFASRIPDKFQGIEFRTGAGGTPLIVDCAAWLECRTHSHQDAGDHILFIGEVERFERTEKKPLIFCGGKYVFSEREADAASLTNWGWGL